jgi:hypothetical protein
VTAEAPPLPDELAKWLLGQIARDEATAHAMTHAIENLQSRWSPARLLADCEGKRRVIEAYERCAGYWTAADQAELDRDWRVMNAEMDVYRLTLRLLALPYAHLPGYRAEWRP